MIIFLKYLPNLLQREQGVKGRKRKREGGGGRGRRRRGRRIKGRGDEKGGGGERFVQILQMSTTAGLAQAEASIQEVHPTLREPCQEPNT